MPSDRTEDDFERPRSQWVVLRDSDTLSTGDECLQLYMTSRLALPDVPPLLTQALNQIISGEGAG